VQDYGEENNDGNGSNGNSKNEVEVINADAQCQGENFIHVVVNN